MSRDDWDDEDASDDEFDAESSEFGAPLPQEDRLWRHPSEVGRAAAAARMVDAKRTRRQNILRWASIPVAALAGAGAALGVVGMTSGFRPRTEIQVVEAPRTPISAILDQPGAFGFATSREAIVRKIGPTIGRVEVVTPAGTTAGSAVALRVDGYYLTSAQLVGATPAELFVTTSEGNRRRAQMIGADAYTNVAVVRILGEQVREPEFESPSSQLPGSDAVVLSAVQTGEKGPMVTQGVISALGRRLLLEDGRMLLGMVQTDASASSGVLGGAILNADGKVIAIVTTVTPPSGNDPAVVYGTPADVAMAVAEDLIDYGFPGEAWLGLRAVSVSSEQARAIGVTGGALVNEVVIDGPAASAGLAPDDVITEIDGKPIASMADLVTELRTYRSGDWVELVYQRGGDAFSTVAILDPPPDRRGPPGLVR